jgi:hypothetical protein
LNGWGAGLSEAGARGVKACLLAFLTGVASGCYVYVPVATTPEPGMQVAFNLNDQGRVGLGQSIGAAASKVEGTIQSNTDSAYQLRVTAVSYMNGQSNPWTGEPLMLRKDFVRDMLERKYSRNRSFLTGALVVGTAAVFIISRSLLGSGSNPREPGDGGGGGSQ